jgi:hypothetical protein
VSVERFERKIGLGAPPAHPRRRHLRAERRRVAEIVPREGWLWRWSICWPPNGPDDGIGTETGPFITRLGARWHLWFWEGM